MISTCGKAYSYDELLPRDVIIKSVQLTQSLHDEQGPLMHEEPHIYRTVCIYQARYDGLEVPYVNQSNDG